MKNIIFATVATFGLAVSISAFAMASNNRILTNSIVLPRGITWAHGTTVADGGGGESQDRNGRGTVV